MFFNKEQQEPQLIAQALRGAGHRLTQPRMAVIRVLSQAEDWLRPDQVLELARRYWPPLGLVTVYRTLALMSRLGVIRRVHLEDGCHGYARTALPHGHHLLCRSCKQVVEFAGSEALAPMMARISRATGFVIEGHMLELLGLCPACQSGA